MITLGTIFENRAKKLLDSGQVKRIDKFEKVDEEQIREANRYLQEND